MVCTTYDKQKQHWKKFQNSLFSETKVETRYVYLTTQMKNSTMVQNVRNQNSLYFQNVFSQNRIFLT